MGKLLWKYEHPEEDDFIVDEVFSKDGELYATAINEEESMTFRLYPIGESRSEEKAAW